jgi:hypothetical protein
MLRRTAVILVAALAAIVIPAGAAAGGGAVFNFNRDYYVPGDLAVGQTVFSTSKEHRHLLDRTFYAYLIPESRWIDPPRIPKGSVPIGTVSLDGLAQVSFRIPDVAPGHYTVGMCDRPCRHAYVGDLVGGWITVVGSREEARLRGLIDRLERRLDGVRGGLSKQGERANHLAKEIAGLTTTTGKWERRQAWLETRLAQLEREPTGLTFDRAGWAVAALAIAALAASMWRRRRRAPTVSPSAAPPAKQPDEVPEWQLEGAIVDENEREPAGVG